LIAKHKAGRVDCRQLIGEKGGGVSFYSIEDKDQDISWVGYCLVLAMGNIDRDAKTCPNCGGIVPEITIKYNGKFFRLTCYNITDMKSHKTILETDYEKLSKYGKSKISHNLKKNTSWGYY
jgi:hypothetical protein